MDDLKDIAKKINEYKSKPITADEINRLSESINRSASKNKIDVNKLASTVAASTASVLTSRMPSIRDMVGAVVSANPILRVGASIGSTITSSITGAFSKSMSEDSSEKATLLQALEELKAGLAQEESSPDNDLKAQGINEQIKLLEDIREELMLMNGYQESESAKEKAKRLRSLDVPETPALDPSAANEGLEDQLNKMIENQERNFALDMMGQTKSLLTGLFGGISSMLGGLLGGGLLASLASGGKLLLRAAGPIGIVVGAVMELYEGFTEAAAFFGKENVSTFDKVRYAITHLLSVALAPVDWLIEKFTGEESNLRESYERLLINLQDKLLGFAAPLLEFVSDAFGMLGGTILKIFDGIGLDTKLVDIPSIIGSNVKQLFLGIWSAISDALSVGIDKLTEGMELADEVKNSVLKAVGDFFSNIFNTALDWVTEKIRGLDFFGSDLVADQIDYMRETPLLEQRDRINQSFSETNSITKLKTQSDAELTDAAMAARMANTPKSGMEFRPQEAPQSKPSTTIISSPVTTTNSSTTVIKRDISTKPTTRDFRKTAW